MASNSEKSIFRNIIKLASGEGLGRIIGFVVAPIITRIYSPEDLGTLTVYSSLLAIIVPFATCRYSLAIPICKSEKIAFNLMMACFLILITGTLLFGIIFGIFHEPILNMLNMNAIIKYWYLIPIGFLCHGLYEIFSQYSIRKKTLTALAKASVLQKITGSVTKIGLGLLSFKPLGLLIGDLMTQTGGLSVLLRSYWDDLYSSIHTISKNKIKYCIKRFKLFPIYRVPSQILLAAASSLPVMFFAWQFDAKITGQIGIARTMLSIPVTFIGYSVGKAFFAEIASIGKQKTMEIYTLTVSVIKKLFLFSLIPFLLVIMFGPWIFQVVFGPEWYDSGIYARLFSLFLIFQFIYSPISEGIFNVFEKQSKVFMLESSRFIIIIISLSIAYYLHLSPSHTIIFYSIGLALQYIISLVVVFRIIKQSII